MPDAIRLEFAAPLGTSVSALLDDLAAMLLALSAPEMVALVDEVRPVFESGIGSVARVVPARWLASWFPQDVALPDRIGIVMVTRVAQTVVGDVVTPVECQAEMLYHAVPTGSFDVGQMIPWVELLSAANGTAGAWPRKTEGGDVTCYVLPSGWQLLAGPLLTVSSLYGIEGEQPEPPGREDMP